MNAATKIMAKLNEVFTPLDSEVLAASLQWAKQRKQAMLEFQSSDEYKALRGNSVKRYNRVIEIAGGKSWYGVMCGCDESIAEFVTKNCARIAESRNTRITDKLKKAGITEILSEEISHTDDGFNGVFGINTDQGPKRVKVETVRAGGHNIQCLHLRVLVKIK